MQELVLHIGAAKTGSTSIQAFLEKHKERLKKQQVLYPDTGKTSNHHYDIARLIPDIDSLKQKLETETQGYDRIILSSEHFSMFEDKARIQAYRDILSAYEVTVYCYLRDPLSWLVSLYGEHIKWGGKRSIDDFFRASRWRFNYVALARKWQNVFGEENVRFVNYTKHNNVLEHFCESAVPELLDKVTEKRANKSEPAAFLEILRRLNAAFPQVKTRILLDQMRAQVGRRKIELPHYTWPIRNVIVDTLAAQRDRFNEEILTDFFDTDKYPVVSADDEQENRLSGVIMAFLKPPFSLKTTPAVEVQNDNEN